MTSPHAPRGRTRLPGVIDPKAQGFSPAAYSSLKWWLVADDLDNLAEGAAVVSWADRSGQGHDVSQSTTINQPSLSRNARNGHHAVTFSNDNLVAGSFNLGNAITFFFAFHNTNAEFQGLWDTYPGGGEVVRQVYASTYAGGTTACIDWWPGQPLVTMGLSAQPNLVCVQAYLTGSSPNWVRHVKYWRNASYVGDSTYNEGDTDALIGWGTPEVGAYNTNEGYFVGKLYETLWFNTVLAEADRLAIETYLKGKYAL